MLGATVNLAARLEGFNKNYATSILVSSALRQLGTSRFLFRSVDRINPKGFAQAFEIYELRCERGDGDAKNCELCSEWEAVCATLRKGPSAAAECELARFLAKHRTTAARVTIAAIGPDMAGIPRRGKRTDFHFTRKRSMVPRGFVIGRVG